MSLVQPSTNELQPTDGIPLPHSHGPASMDSLTLPTLPIPPPSTKSLTSPDGMRLRLLTLFALYDALPHSIIHSPDGDDPVDLDSAIEPRAIQSYLHSMKEQGKLSAGEVQALSAVYGPPTEMEVNSWLSTARR